MASRSEGVRGTPGPPYDTVGLDGLPPAAPQEGSLIRRPSIVALTAALAIATPTYAQSLADLYVQSEETRLATLKRELAEVTSRNGDKAVPPGRLDELRFEIRRVEGRIRAINASAPRPPDSDPTAPDR